VFTITVSGFTIGNSGSNLASSITVQTSTDTSPSIGISSWPLTCPAGSYWNGQPLMCTPCPAGSSSDAVDSVTCNLSVPTTSAPPPPSTEQSTTSSAAKLATNRSRWVFVCGSAANGWSCEV
jgi:hypothetical protein